MASAITDQMKAQCILWMNQYKSAVVVRRKFRTKYPNYRHNIPSRTVIRTWYSRFSETGRIDQGNEHRGRPPVRPQIVEAIDNIYKENPSTSIRQAAQQVPICKTSVHKVVRKNIKLYPYKIQMLQSLEHSDYKKRETFARTVLDLINTDATFLQRVCFTDEATFHVSGNVNRHNVRIWGRENPHAVIEFERASPKLNVWCGLLHDRVIGPFFFDDPTITQTNFLHLLQEDIYPQLRDRQPGVVFQLDGAPPHWGLDVRASLDEEFPNRWIGRGGPIPWPPRSPDVTPLDFFLWGYVKTIVYKSTVRDIRELRHRIQLAVASITDRMLVNTWRELKVRLEKLRDNGGVHVEVY